MTIYDFHLHWYPGFRIDRFEARLGSLVGEYAALVGVVHNTERCSCFEEFRKVFAHLPLEGVEESESRLLGRWRDGGVPVVFYRGAQLVSEENLELLVIGASPDTGKLPAMVDEALALGSVVLLPWGFGKWRGARGQVVEAVLANPRPGLFVSDSGTRPNSGLGASLLQGVFERVARYKRLDGSDPLPMPEEETFPFSVGMKGEALEDFPEDTAAFAEFLRAKADQLAPSGDSRTTPAAIHRQVCLRRRAFRLGPVPAPSVPGRSDAGDIESSTDRYARRFSGEVGAFFLERQSQLTLDLAERDGRTQPGKILDIGGGHAQLAPHFLKRGWAVSIFSSDDSCRKRPDRLMGAANYQFATGDLLHLPYPDNSFDLVTVFRMVPHETEWETLIAEAARVARHQVILDYPDIRSFNALSRGLFLIKKAVEKDTREFALFTRQRISQAMEEAGLEDLRWRPQFFLPMALYRLAGSGRFAAGCEAFFQRIGLTAILGSPVIVSGIKMPKP